MTVRLNLSDDEAHALLCLLQRAEWKGRNVPRGTYQTFEARMDRLAQNTRTVRSKLERAERRRAAR